MEILILAIVFSLILGGAILFISSKEKARGAQERQFFDKLEQQNQAQLKTILDQFINQQRSLEHNTGQIGNRLLESSTVIKELQTKLAVLEENNRRILAMSKGMEELQNILQAPKLRGEKGEIWLEELLSQMLPKTSFNIQHKFKSGEICDAVILLREKLVLPIDSKFPLENFRKVFRAETDSEKKAFEKLFITDVKKRIDEISSKYILPDEHTLNYALMYVPAENVYYQAFIEDRGGFGLTHYALERHVIPVSPNSIYPYLEIILMGLKGLEIEQSALTIQQGILGLQGELVKFAESFRKVGQNLRIATNHFEQSDKRLIKIGNKLERIGGGEAPILIEEGDDEI